MASVRVIDPERAEWVRRLTGDDILPVIDAPILAKTPHAEEPELCWLLDLPKLSDEQLQTIAYFTGQRFNVDASLGDLLAEGMPIPVTGTEVIG